MASRGGCRPSPQRHGGAGPQPRLQRPAVPRLGSETSPWRAIIDSGVWVALKFSSGAPVTLAVKLMPPSPGPAYVVRPRLRDRLAEALQRRLTLVVAAPGFGKS